MVQKELSLILVGISNVLLLLCFSCIWCVYQISWILLLIQFYSHGCCTRIIWHFTSSEFLLQNAINFCLPKKIPELLDFCFERIYREYQDACYTKEIRGWGRQNKQFVVLITCSLFYFLSEIPAIEGQHQPPNDQRNSLITHRILIQNGHKHTQITTNGFTINPFKNAWIPVSYSQHHEFVQLALHRSQAFH